MSRVVGPQSPGVGSVDSSTRDPNPLAVAENVCIRFPVRSGVFSRVTGYVRAVDGVSLQVARGETFGVVGESGCGKSTLARGLIRLREVSHGVVRFDGVDLGALSRTEIRRFRRRMQIVYQDPYSSLDPRMTAGATIKEPLLTHGLAPGIEMQRVYELLSMVGLTARDAVKYPHEFSGGQRQRIGIARALAVEPEFLVLDEPVSALDVSIQAQVLNLLADLRDQFHLTYLFISHDLSVVRHICNRVGVMYLGQIVEIGSTSTVFRTPAHPYTKALLSAIRVPDPTVERSRRRIVLEGDVPSPIDPPTGCRFRGRCWLYQLLGHPQICADLEPSLTEIEWDHRAACHFRQEVDGAIPHASRLPPV